MKLIDRPLPLCTPSGSLATVASCEVVLARVWEYLDGASSPVMIRAIDTHLESCPGCHAQYTFQQAFLRCLRGYAKRALLGTFATPRALPRRDSTQSTEW